MSSYSQVRDINFDSRSTQPTIRVLVIGRESAGKRTLMEKLCSYDMTYGIQPMFYDARGHRIGRRDRVGLRALSEYFQSGKRHVFHQIRPSPGSRFTFHVSRGMFEDVGEELQNVRYLMHRRGFSAPRSEQLHAIWLCISMDRKEPVLKDELSVLNEIAGQLPVVVVFTKYDALYALAHEALSLRAEANSTKKGISMGDISLEAERMYEESYYQPVVATEYPPKVVIQLENMQEIMSTFPSQLLEDTSAAIHKLGKHADIDQPGRLDNLGPFWTDEGDDKEGTWSDDSSHSGSPSDSHTSLEDDSASPDDKSQDQRENENDRDSLRSHDREPSDDAKSAPQQSQDQENRRVSIDSLGSFLNRPAVILKKPAKQTAQAAMLDSINQLDFDDDTEPLSSSLALVPEDHIIGNEPHHRRSGVRHVLLRLRARLPVVRDSVTQLAPKEEKAEDSGATTRCGSNAGERRNIHSRCVALNRVVTIYTCKAKERLFYARDPRGNDVDDSDSEDEHRGGRTSCGPRRSHGTHRRGHWTWVEDESVHGDARICMCFA